MFRALLLLVVAIPSLSAADVDALLPPEGEQLVYVNVKRLATSPLFQSTMKSEFQTRLQGTGVTKWLEEAGVDPWKDIETISMCSTPPKPKDKDAEKKTESEPKPEEKPTGMAFVVVRGTFNGEKLIGAAEKAVRDAGDLFSIIKENGVRIVKLKAKNGPEFFITLADEKTLIAATETKFIHDAIKLHDSKATKPQVRKELIALTAKLDGKAAFYQAMVLDGKQIASSVRENPLFEDTDLLRAQVSEIVSYSIVARVSRDLAFEAAVGMTSKAHATPFSNTASTMIEKGMTLIGLFAASQPQFSGVINDLSKSLKVSADGDIVKLRGKITGNAICKAFGIEID